jgi:hypothetical protein
MPNYKIYFEGTRKLKNDERGFKQNKKRDGNNILRNKVDSYIKSNVQSIYKRF